MGKKPKKFEPDFNVSALFNACADARPCVKGMTIDGSGTKMKDDGIAIERRPDKSWVVKVSIADVAAMIPDGHSFEDIARVRGAESRDAQDRVTRIFPHDYMLDHVSLEKGTLRPAITFRMILDSDLNLTGSSIFKSMFLNRSARSMDDIDRDVRNGNPHMVEWANLAVGLHQKRRKEMAQLADRNVSGNEAPSLPARRDSPFAPLNAGKLIVREVMLLANEVATRYLQDNHLPGKFTFRPGHKVEVIRVTSDFNFDRRCNGMARQVVDDLSEESNLDAHVTSPMRYYDDYASLKVIGQHLDNPAQNIHHLRPDYARNPFRKVTRQNSTALEAWVWKGDWSRLLERQNALKSPQRNSGGMAGALANICHRNRWAMPEIAERSIIFNDRRIYLVAMAFKKEGHQYQVVWAVNHDLDAARETASYRLLHRLKDSAPHITIPDPEKGGSARKEDVRLRVDG